MGEEQTDIARIPISSSASTFYSLIFTDRHGSLRIGGKADILRTSDNPILSDLHSGVWRMSALLSQKGRHPPNFRRMQTQINPIISDYRRMSACPR